MRAGDNLIYGNGRRVRIVNFPVVNGEPGIQLDDKDAMFACERFKTLADVQSMLLQGVWKVESPNPAAAIAQRGGT